MYEEALCFLIGLAVLISALICTLTFLSVYEG
jgi:hypothetical protein